MKDTYNAVAKGKDYDDLNDIIFILDRAGIEYKIIKELYANVEQKAEFQFEIWDGYEGFHSLFSFDKNGSLLSVKAYE